MKLGLTLAPDTSARPIEFGLNWVPMTVQYRWAASTAKRFEALAPVMKFWFTPEPSRLARPIVPLPLVQ